MNWRDKVHAMRDGTNSAIVPAPLLPKLPKPGFVGSVSALPLHIPEKKEAANDSPPVQAANPEADANPDRWCYPHSTAMNTMEVDAFTARLSRFTDKGLSIADGEGLADKQVSWDREQDDRHSCFECTHLAGSGGWRCGNWQRAGVAIRARDAQLPIDLVNLLQRCDGFSQAIHFQKQTGGRHGKTQAN